MKYLSFDQFVKKIDQLEEANILLAALEFRVFTHLEKNFLTHLSFAKKAGIDSEGAESLLNALASIGAIKKTGNKFSNTSESYKHLCERSPHYKRGTVFLRKENRDEWSNLINIIRDGRNSTRPEDNDPEFRKPFSHAMHERSRKYSKPLAEFIARKPVGKLIDIGAGPGSYSFEILKIDKLAQAALIDRPASLEVANELIKNTSIKKRISFVKGDIFKVEFEKDTDTALYSNILHIYNVSENQKLIKKIYTSLKRGGRLIIVDLFLHKNRIKPYDAALFSLTMLMFTATGKTYTFEETEILLKRCGFGNFKRFDLGEGSSVIEAVKI